MPFLTTSKVDSVDVARSTFASNSNKADPNAKVALGALKNETSYNQRPVRTDIKDRNYSITWIDVLGGIILISSVASLALTAYVCTTSKCCARWY